MSDVLPEAAIIRKLYEKILKSSKDLVRFDSF